MKTQEIYNLEAKGYKTLKQIANKCGKQSISSGKLFCELYNILPAYSFPFARGTLNYYAPEDVKKITGFVSQNKNTLCNYKRNPSLKGLSIEELCKKYKIKRKTAVNNKLCTENDFIQYDKKRKTRQLSPVTLCKKYGVKLSTFISYKGTLEPTEENIFRFSIEYKNKSDKEKKEHTRQKHVIWNQSDEAIQSQKKALDALHNMSSEKKQTTVLKCKESKIKNGTLGYNSQCKYKYKDKGYNLTELAIQLANPEWERINTVIFHYFVDNKLHDYSPDFFDKKNNQYIEIKGKFFFNRDGKFIDPYNYNRLKKGLITEKEYQLFQNKADAKYKCMLENNVRIIIDSSEEVKQAKKQFKDICKQYRYNKISYIYSSRKGAKISKQQRFNMSKSKTKPFKCLNNGKTYYSLRQCADELNIKSVTSITNVCLGISKKTKQGYIFKYIH